MEISNSEVIVEYRDERGTRLQKRIPVTSLTAFILNNVNQRSANRLVENEDRH